MATVAETFPVAPERVFGVLDDPRSLAYFVVGSRNIRRFDPRWPDTGTTVHHTVGIGPFAIRDTTEVVEVHRPTRLVLDTRLRPLGAFSVTFSITAGTEGSTLTVEEHPVRGLVALPGVRRVVDAALVWRNRWMTHRVGRLVDRRERQREMARRDG